MKACLFDIDGTLIQTGGAGQVAFAQTFADKFDVPQLSSDVSFAGRSDRAIALDLMEAHGIGVTEQHWQTFREGYAERLPAALASCVGRVLPGVESLIAKLQHRGDVLIGLLTGNLRQTAELKLDYYGLWGPFGFGGFGDAHLNRNDIASTAVQQAWDNHSGPVGPEAEATIVVIGDTPHDITCAHSVDARAVAVSTGGASADELQELAPELLVESLEDSSELLSWFDA